MKWQQSDAADPYRDQKDLSVCGLIENLLTVATAPGCQSQWTATAGSLVSDRKHVLYKTDTSLTDLSSSQSPSRLREGGKVQPCHHNIRICRGPAGLTLADSVSPLSWARRCCCELWSININKNWPTTAAPLEVLPSAPSYSSGRCYR